MNLAGRTASGFIDRWLETKECVLSNNNVGNTVSDADGMKDMWRKYMEKLLNAENEWDGEVGCAEVMWPCCLNSKEEVTTALKGIQI